jgi:hypothetical protein
MRRVELRVHHLCDSVRLTPIRPRVLERDYQDDAGREARVRPPMLGQNQRLSQGPDNKTAPKRSKEQDLIGRSIGPQVVQFRPAPIAPNVKMKT